MAKEKKESQTNDSKSNDRKTLGLDPFEDLDGLDWEESDSTAEEAALLSTGALSAPPAAQESSDQPAAASSEDRPAPDAEVMPEVQPPAEEPVTPDDRLTPDNRQTPDGQPSPEDRPAPEAPLPPDAELSSAEQSSSEAPVTPDDPPSPKPEDSLNPQPVLSDVERSKIRNPQSEPPQSEIRNPQSEPAQSDALDELIATIDEEIQQIFGSEGSIEAGSELPAGPREREEQFVIFSLAGAEYAARAANVREVGEIVHLTPVPNVPDWLLGVTNLRGDVLSVVDLRGFLGIEQLENVEARLRDGLAFEGGQEMLVAHPRQDASLLTTGLVVDEVSDIRYLSVDQISAPGAPMDSQIAPYLRGVYDHEGRLLIVLDFERLLLSPEMRQFEPI